MYIPSVHRQVNIWISVSVMGTPCSVHCPPLKQAHTCTTGLCRVAAPGLSIAMNDSPFAGVAGGVHVKVYMPSPSLERTPPSGAPPSIVTLKSLVSLTVKV